jgi:hypothetical protein
MEDIYQQLETIQVEILWLIGIATSGQSMVLSSLGGIFWLLLRLSSKKSSRML